jgi:hypothetical protein
MSCHFGVTTAREPVPRRRPVQMTNSSSLSFCHLLLVSVVFPQVNIYYIYEVPVKNPKIHVPELWQPAAASYGLHAGCQRVPHVILYIMSHCR